MNIPERYIRYLKEGVSIRCESDMNIDNVLTLFYQLNIKWANGCEATERSHTNRIKEYLTPYIITRSYGDQIKLSYSTCKPVDIPWEWTAEDFVKQLTQGTNCPKKEETTAVVKIDYVQFRCPKCGTPMKALFRLDNQYCPRGCS